MSVLTAGDVISMQAVINTTLPDSGTITRRTQTSDGQGGKNDTWTAVGTVACRVSPLSARKAGGEETHADQIQAMRERWITLPAGTDITETDRISVVGQTFEIEAMAAPRSWELSRRVSAVRI